jgi:replicative DNA helicase
MNRLYKSKFACVTVPDLQMDKVSSIVRRYQKRNGCQAVIVDYIGRMDTMDGKLREDQVLLNAAKRLKTLAQQTKTVMFMVAQVRGDGKLQSATYMENEADLHLRLEPLPESVITTMQAQLLPWNYKVHISKGRNCGTGWTLFSFVGEKLTFYGEE